MIGQEELLSIFREEARELVDRLATEAEALKRAVPDESQEIIETLLRVVHNLKGTASTVGIDDIASLAHAMEDNLEQLKQDPEGRRQERIALLIEAITVSELLVDGQPEQHSARVLIDGMANVGSNEELEPKSSEPLKSDGETSGAVTAETSKSIRVDTSRFDRVMSFSGELLVAQAKMESHHGRLDRFFKEIQRLSRYNPEQASMLANLLREARPLVQEHRQDLLEFGHLTTEIGDAMKRVRMVPLARAAPEWRRIVRESAHLTGKEIELEIQSGGIELDKHVLDQLRDPMMHLLRNAIDHGIESSKEREKKGKPASGRVRIEASLVGAMIRLGVSDDGRGLDAKSVRSTAIKKGVITEEQAGVMSEEEILDLVFRSGFSTTEKISKLSGRGVGLDVVRTRVEDLGGSVSILSDSSTGGSGGVTFHLSVPLSILSTLGLFVRSGENSYALPMEYVVRTLRLRRGDLQQVDGKPAIRVGSDDPIRVAWLADLMNTGSYENQETLKVVVLSRADVQLGLVVCEIEGQQEFVTQALPWNFKSVPGVNGAIIRADATLVVSLDVPYLFECTRFIEGTIGKRRNKEVPEARRRILVVDDSMASRTLERNMLKEAGYQVEIASDGSEAWQMLLDEDYDLLVSDVDMPVLDGLELTKRVRQSSKLNDLPVVLVTAKGGPEHRAAGARAGADEYVVKGAFDQSTLLELVGKYL